MTDARPARRLAITGTVTAALVALAAFGIFFVAPEDADQGIIQKIFYFHVAIALTSLVAFGVACVAAILYLRSREERYDEVSSISVGIGLGMAVLVVITGSIWAKASWGTWWVWTDPRLVTFVIVLLLYAAYFVLRSSVEGELRLRYSAIYSIAAFASVPLSFYSVRVARSFVHPVVHERARHAHRVERQGDRGEGGDRVDRRVAQAQLALDRGAQHEVGGVQQQHDHEGDQARVGPDPPGAPRGLGPDRPGDDHEHSEGEADADRDARDLDETLLA